MCYTFPMDKTFKPVLTMRIFTDAGEKSFGPGVAELLRRVKEERSLRAAAISMAMAYSKAWTVIKNAEATLGFPLLVSTTGGKNGGGATLSPKAEALLSAYDEYCTALRAYSAEEFSRTLAPMLNRK